MAKTKQEEFAKPKFESESESGSEDEDDKHEGNTGLNLLTDCD